jgi:predicted NACHT family NTPase
MDLLRNCAKDIISLLESNIGIASKRGLHVFGFLQLSFQEYFVALGLINIKNSSIEQVAKRI